jgi:hypothetical protein
VCFLVCMTISELERTILTTLCLVGAKSTDRTSIPSTPFHIPFCHLCKYPHKSSVTTQTGGPYRILALGDYLGYG